MLVGELVIFVIILSLFGIFIGVGVASIYAGVKFDEKLVVVFGVFVIILSILGIFVVILDINMTAETIKEWWESEI